MKYSATSQRILILFMALLCLFVSFLSWDSTAIKWISFMLFILFVFVSFVKFTLVLNQHNILYTIELFRLTIYRQDIESTNIKEIIFKRAGWKSKVAAIRVKKGVPIRIALFKPDRIYVDLIRFCEQNAVPYNQTKDFRIIEKMG
jgi:hypothetical protein